MTDHKIRLAGAKTLRPRPRPVAKVVAMAAAVALLAGCTSVSVAPSAVQPLGAGFLGDIASPSPEATVSPEDGSWDGVVPPDGYRVVLISAGNDDATKTLVAAVDGWAQREDVELHALTATDDDEVEARINEAVAMHADLVVGAGTGVIDVFSLLTAQHLAQQFLVVGAQLPEPTENVTSVVWSGATFRGTGLGAAGEQDTASVTPELARDAVTAGVASVLHGLTGIVLELGA
ncbi:BMP family ABC transporter substrate-binding protein [Arthrobacter sp. NPDC056886]|uniref:BMP family ABC transporter substrate-binding protein n=1 Tax=Arthrobacter sp. NPDC056886 TaxID=3345960 RepID=UPI003670D561